MMKVFKQQVVFWILAVCLLISRSTSAWAEETLLLKGGVSMDADTQAELNAEDSRHDGKMASLDAVDHAEDKDHETKLKLIEESDSTAKSLLKANENAQHERKKKDVGPKQ